MTTDWAVWAVGIVAIAAFAVAFQVSGLVSRARAAVTAVSDAVAVMTDRNLDDAEKERIVQRAAIRMLGQFVLITLAAIAVLAAPVAVMWIGDRLAIATFAAVSALLLSWEVIVGASLLFLGAWLAMRRR